MDGFTDVPQPQPVDPAPQATAASALPPGCVVKVTLAEPIEITSTTGAIITRIEELFFRKPTAMDLIEVGGNPVLMDAYSDDPMSTVRFDAKQMTAMMARLSATPPPFLAKMGTGDWTFCAWQLSGFFLPARPRS